jgi:glycosyltransferase involved in cell wall biosynthesis
LEASLKEKIKALRMESFVSLIPNQENIFPILSQAKALVMPSKIEGLPGVILEAMYCQVPVVAYGVGGIPEVVINKETGWCVDSGDSEAFKESLLEVLNTPLNELEKITAVAKELVLKNYQMEQIAKDFEMFYGSVIANAETTYK